MRDLVLSMGSGHRGRNMGLVVHRVDGRRNQETGLAIIQRHSMGVTIVLDYPVKLDTVKEILVRFTAVGGLSARIQSAPHLAEVDTRNVPENAITLLRNTVAKIAEEISP